MYALSGGIYHDQLYTITEYGCAEGLGVQGHYGQTKLGLYCLSFRYSVCVYTCLGVGGQSCPCHVRYTIQVRGRYR